MLSGTTLTSPLSPRPETSSSKKCVSSKTKLLIGCIFFCLTAFVAITLAVYFTNDSRVDSSGLQNEFLEEEDVLHLGDISICSWELVPVEETVLVNGEMFNFTTPVIEGETCDTGKLVILVIGTEGVHGNIGTTRVTAESQFTSRLDEEEQEGFPVYDESPKTRARADQWRHDQDKLSSILPRRRHLLTPGQVDIHLHLDLDQHMITELGRYGASQYAVQLIAVINRDVYHPLGFNLKVVSINLRDSYVSQQSSTSAYLDVIEAEGPLENVNLVHSLTTRSIGGGIAYLGGLYSPVRYGYGVSGSLNGEFHPWDLIVVAHELGHNFGASHTHDMTPQIDTCGVSCPADPSGATIMSYCHLCSGGLSNVEFEFHPRVQAVILQAYSTDSADLAERLECTDLSASVPKMAVPFYLKHTSCLDLPGTTPELCERDSVWVRDTDSGPFRLVSASERFADLWDEDMCWEADCGASSLALAPCSSSASGQQFEFEGAELRSVACAKPVTGTAADALISFEGTLALKQWCRPDFWTASSEPTASTPSSGPADATPAPSMTPSSGPENCENSNNGATDDWGDDCAWYDANTWGCGRFNNDVFRSDEMCCSCGGGVDPTEVTSAPTLVTQEPTLVTQEPTLETQEPSQEPTQQPTLATPEPTDVPTGHPTLPPTAEPSSVVVSQQPTVTTTTTPQPATAQPSAVTTEPTVPTRQPSAGIQCEDSNDGATGSDPWNDDCSWYEANPWGCGKFNDNDFRSEEMCCVCGGGRSGSGPTATPVTPAPTGTTAAPTPTPPVAEEDKCYISECGCGPPFLRSWCHATAHRLTDWCAQSEANCLNCNGAWCPASGPGETTSSPTTSPTTVVSASPTAEMSASPTSAMSASPTAAMSASPTVAMTVFPTAAMTVSPTPALTAAPTSRSPTSAPTVSPVTASPTQSPTETITSTTEEVVPGYSYEEMDFAGKTCKNAHRIAFHCRQQSSCSQSYCQELCDGTEDCLYYFHNERGRCMLFDACDTRRQSATPGVTMRKILVETSSTVDPSSTTEAASPWEQGVKLTHFWDCNGMACDAPTLQPWDLSKYVASPGYSPQNPAHHGGAVYGEKMWLVGAASDSLSELLGEHDPCCGTSSESSGCGKCVLLRVGGAVNHEWTALVMKKNRCPPWSNGCEAGNLHFDIAAPGYDNLQYSTANVCGARENTGFASQEASAVLGDWYNQFGNTAEAGASLCSTLPPQFQEGCELFSTWGWTTGDPQAEYRVVDCPEAFKAHVAAQFDANGVTTL